MTLTDQRRDMDERAYQPAPEVAYQPAPEATRDMAEIPVMVDRINSFLPDIEERVLSIEQRLAPILRLPTPQLEDARKIAVDKEVTGIPLADTIERQADRLWEIYHRLGVLNDRIAL